MLTLPEILVGERLSPEQAQNRYGIKKDAYYSRLKCLRIKHIKDGSFHYLDSTQIGRLDRLHYHLSDGGILADYVEDTSSISLSGNSAVSRRSPSSAVKKMEESFVDYDYDLAAKLDRSAQSVAAGILAEARNRLTAGYLEDPSRIDEDLQGKIFLEVDPTAVDREWAGAHLESAIARVLALEESPD